METDHAVYKVKNIYYLSFYRKSLLASDLNKSTARNKTKPKKRSPGRKHKWSVTSSTVLVQGLSSKDQWSPMGGDGHQQDTGGPKTAGKTCAFPATFPPHTPPQTPTFSQRENEAGWGPGDSACPAAPMHQKRRAGQREPAGVLTGAENQPKSLSYNLFVMFLSGKEENYSLSLG